MAHKKSQAEIFGLALFFVILFLAIIIFSAVSSKKDTYLTYQKDLEFDLLGTNTLEALLQKDVNCEISRSNNNLRELLRICVRDPDETLTCQSGQKNPCQYAKEILKNSASKLFEKSDAVLVNVPYQLTLQLKEDKNHKVNFNITNLKKYKYLNKTRITRRNYRSYKFQRKTSTSSIKTTKRQLNVFLEIFYR